MTDEPVAGDAACGQTTSNPSSPAFADWFAGSVVRDTDGGPLVVFHWTYNEFEPADFDRLWAARYFKRDPEGIDAVGLWFTDSREIRYASTDWGGRRMDVVLAIRRPLELDDDGTADAWLRLRDMIRAAGGATAFRGRLAEMGHDGVVLRDTMLDRHRQTVFLALEASQVRSATSGDGREGT